MRCIKAVAVINCNFCKGETIRFGKVGTRQRYRCKNCSKTQLDSYKKKAYWVYINNYIVAYLKEGCGIRSIARLLSISANTVLKRIKIIANQIANPKITQSHIYEVDELKTYIRNKQNDCWIIYAIDKATGEIADFKVGKRTKANVHCVVNSLVLSGCKQIYTDKLNLYKYVIAPNIHTTRRFGTNKIERKNLCLRTHLKRLNRKTICYSKSIVMLAACLKIYFWYKHRNMLDYNHHSRAIASQQKKAVGCIVLQ